MCFKPQLDVTDAAATCHKGHTLNMHLFIYSVPVCAEKTRWIRQDEPHVFTHSMHFTFTPSG